MRIVFGLDRLPRNLDEATQRLLSVSVDNGAPLCLNTEPIPLDPFVPPPRHHGERIALARSWLHAGCGDYAPLRRRFIDLYFETLAAEIESARNGITPMLTAYHDLYTADDLLWFALRPLPRAWLPISGSWLSADIAYWDGSRAHAMLIGAREPFVVNALDAGGVAVWKIERDILRSGDLTRFRACLPQAFWGSPSANILPSSPFRSSVAWPEATQTFSSRI